MSWYEAAAWGALGGLAMELYAYAYSAARHPGIWRYPNGIGWSVKATVIFIRSLFGALIGLGLNQIYQFPFYALIPAGIAANYLLMVAARAVPLKSADQELASRVKSEADLLDSVRKPERTAQGISPDVNAILEARRSALADQLPLAANEGGGSS